MAKLNWQRVVKQKHNTDHIVFERKINQAGRDWNKLSSTLYEYSDCWPCKGKYLGVPMSKLSLNYLQWVGMNFDTKSRGYHLAVAELTRRSAK